MVMETIEMTAIQGGTNPPPAPHGCSAGLTGRLTTAEFLNPAFVGEEEQRLTPGVDSGCSHSHVRCETGSRKDNNSVMLPATSSGEICGTKPRKDNQILPSSSEIKRAVVTGEPKPSTSGAKLFSCWLPGFRCKTKKQIETAKPPVVEEQPETVKLPVIEVDDISSLNSDGPAQNERFLTRMQQPKETWVYEPERILSPLFGTLEKERTPKKIHNAFFARQRLLKATRKVLQEAHETTDPDEKEALTEAAEMALVEVEAMSLCSTITEQKTVESAEHRLLMNNRYAVLNVDTAPEPIEAESALSAEEPAGEEPAPSDVKVKRKRRFPDRKLQGGDIAENILYPETEDRPVYAGVEESVPVPEAPTRFAAKIMTAEADLYQTLLAEALFLPRLPGLTRQLKLKAKQFWNGFDCSDITQKQITEKTARAIAAAMTPSAVEIECMRYWSHSSVQEILKVWNAFIADLRPPGFMERIKSKVVRELIRTAEAAEEGMLAVVRDLGSEIKEAFEFSEAENNKPVGEPGGYVDLTGTTTRIAGAVYNLIGT